MQRRCSLLARAACALLSLAAPCAAQSAFESYGEAYRPVSLPAAAAGSAATAGATLPDGRILAVTGLGVYRETGAGSGAFELVATLDAGQMGETTDPAFIRVSPDGGRIAVGGGADRPVAVFAASSLGTGAAPASLTPGIADYFHVPHFDAAWADSTRLALTAGGSDLTSRITLLDVTSAPAAPLNRTIIDNIRGASGGIAFDSAGRLYTGNGYGGEPGWSTTGTLRAFAASVLDAPAPEDFETGGVLIGEVLSATSLSFDVEGNLLVGGGDFGEFDVGYLGVISGGALAAALAGLGPIDASDPSQLRRLTPTTDPFAFYGSAFNPATGEAYVTYTDFFTGETTWFATIPAPGGAVVLTTFAIAAGRRGRRG